MNLSGPPSPPVDLKDPRIRVTFADVAMKLVNDGPMYGVLVLLLVLALRGTTSATDTIYGLAIAMLARSHPPTSPDKGTILKNLGAAGLVVLALGAAGVVHAATGKKDIRTAARDVVAVIGR